MLKWNKTIAELKALCISLWPGGDWSCQRAKGAMKLHYTYHVRERNSPLSVGIINFWSSIRTVQITGKQSDSIQCAFERAIQAPPKPLVRVGTRGVGEDKVEVYQEVPE